MSINKVILTILVVLAVFGPLSVLKAQQPIPAKGNNETLGIGAQRLMQLRAELAMELREIQRTLALIDPNDARLAETLKIQQADALDQLLDVEKDLKAMGINLEAREPANAAAQEAPPTPADPARQAESVPAAENPLVPAPARTMTDPQNMEEYLQTLRDREMRTEMPGSTFPGIPGRENATPRGQLNPLFGGEGSPVPAFQGNPEDVLNPAIPPDPWAPRASKETQELQKSVNALQDEVKSLRKQIESLEDQIRLLTKLLSK